MYVLLQTNRPNKETKAGNSLDSTHTQVSLFHTHTTDTLKDGYSNPTPTHRARFFLFFFLSKLLCTFFKKATLSLHFSLPPRPLWRVSDRPEKQENACPLCTVHWCCLKKSPSFFPSPSVSLCLPLSPSDTLIAISLSACLCVLSFSLPFLLVALFLPSLPSFCSLLSTHPHFS